MRVQHSCIMYPHILSNNNMLLPHESLMFLSKEPASFASTPSLREKDSRKKE